MKNTFSRCDFVRSAARVAGAFAAMKDAFAIGMQRPPAELSFPVRLGLARYTFRNFSRELSLLMGKQSSANRAACALLLMDCSTPSPAMRLFPSTLGVANARAIARLPRLNGQRWCFLLNEIGKAARTRRAAGRWQLQQPGRIVGALCPF
jgi:hypothetical protein